MLAIKIDPEQLYSVFSPFGAFVTECSVNVSKDGMNVSAVDVARIGLVNMTVGASVFKSFEANGESFGLPVNRFLDVVSLCENIDDVLYMRFNESENTLEMQCGGLYYSLSLLEVDSIKHVPEVPDLDLSCSATFKSSELTDAVSAGSMFSDFVTFRSNGSKVSVSGGGENNAILSKNHSELVRFNGGDANSTFKASYFNSILNEIDEEREITIDFGIDYPALVTFSPVNMDCSVEYVLAPRIKGSG